MVVETRTGTVVDGRRQRAERTRQHILEAYIALLRSNPRPPTANQIADRAGYSVRSLFERFPDLLSLSLAAADMAFAQANAQATIRNLHADRATRIRSKVETRARTCEDWLSLWRALILNQHASSDLRQRIRRVRQASLARIEMMFRPELDTLEADDRRCILIALEAITDFESWARMREGAGLPVEEACAVWIRAIDSLLPETPPSAHPAS